MAKSKTVAKADVRTKGKTKYEVVFTQKATISESAAILLRELQKGSLFIDVIINKATKKETLKTVTIYPVYGIKGKVTPTDFKTLLGYGLIEQGGDGSSEDRGDRICHAYGTSKFGQKAKSNLPLEIEED